MVGKTGLEMGVLPAEHLGISGIIYVPWISKFLAGRALLVPESVGIEQLANSGEFQRCFLSYIKYLLTASEVLPPSCALLGTVAQMSGAELYS